VDSALNQDQSELGVLVSAALLQVLSDVHSLFDQMVEIFGDLRSEACLLQNTQNLAASHALDLGNAVAVSESDADLGGGASLLGELHNLLDEVVGGNLDPAGGRLAVGEASAGNTLALRGIRSRSAPRHRRR